MSEELKSCPFCGEQMEPFGPDQFNHPAGECWLAHVRLMKGEVARWNRRVSPQSPDVDDARDAARYRAWRNCVITDDDDFREATANALPDDDELNTAAEWDAAIDAAMSRTAKEPK